ncbi:hypothetical protein [Streptomyces avermitilis]|uniref:hypothetical protein n=1 Tax=Streptomyces avermitilis TaxID=33903 RepID=UPI0036B1F7DF
MAGPGKAVTETFAFSCANCGATWDETFEVVFPTDPLGQNTQEYVEEDGTALRSPLTAAVCPECGSRKVRVTSPELAPRARTAEQAARSQHHDHHLHLPHLHHKDDGKDGGKDDRPDHGRDHRPDQGPDHGPGDSGSR